MSQGKSGILQVNQPVIALGSNVEVQFGGALAILKGAILALERKGLPLVARSAFYATPSFPKGNGPDFVNAVIKVGSNLAPVEILQLLHRVEEMYARERAHRWAPRTLDLDLIAIGDTILPDSSTVETWINLPLERQMKEAPDQLILPHPRLQDRAFVLIPLAEVAPEWVHPVLGISVKKMLKTLPEVEKAEIRPIA